MDAALHASARHGAASLVAGGAATAPPVCLQCLTHALCAEPLAAKRELFVRYATVARLLSSRLTRSPRLAFAARSTCSEVRGRCAADAALTWRIAAAPEVAAALAHALADAAARRDGALRAEVSSLAAALAAAAEPLRDELSADLARRAAAAPYGEESVGGLLAALAPLLALQPRNAPLGSEPDAVVAACAAALRSPRFGISHGKLLSCNG